MVVLERHYLDVYPYDKWVGNTIPEFQEGEEFDPSVCELREGATTKPNLLTEADLVSLMDKNGIGRSSSFFSLAIGSRWAQGTDATIAQHIQMVIDREYVIERMEGATKYLVPSTLGVGLISGYDQIGFEKSLSKPQLRREVRLHGLRIQVRHQHSIRQNAIWFKYAAVQRTRMICWLRQSTSTRKCSSLLAGILIQSLK